MYVPQQMINQYFILCLFTSRGDIRPNIYICKRVHLHIVFVLLYVLWVCRSVGVLSCVYVSRSFTYALRVVI